jgi:hypothetical protein
LYADHTPPGGAQTIARFRIDVQDGPVMESATKPPELKVSFHAPKVIRAGEDVRFEFGVDVNDLEPYLGAWAHIMILSADGGEFIHAHPLDDAASTVDTSPWQHSHAAPGPSPSTIATITGFRKPGTYKLWAQFQRAGQVITIPWSLQVLPAEAHRETKDIPKGAVPVKVSSSGFSPARLTAAAGQPLTLAFRRDDAASCANSVVFPELGIRRDLPVGETVLIEVPASDARELHFACGMNMYRGALLIKR